MLLQHAARGKGEYSEQSRHKTETVHAVVGIAPLGTVADVLTHGGSLTIGPFFIRNSNNSRAL
jgi:hypothetical protein